MTTQATARYEGFTEVGCDCFSVAIQELKPRSTVKARVFFANRTGRSGFVIGDQYSVILERSQDSKFSPVSFNVLHAE